MPRVTKLEKQFALEQLAEEVLPMIRERFVEEEKGDQRYESFHHDGWYYRNFRKIYLSGGMLEIRVERFTVPPGEKLPVKRKDWNGRIFQDVWIYTAGENVRYDGKYRGTDPGFIYEGYSFQNFTHRHF